MRESSQSNIEVRAQHGSMPLFFAVFVLPFLFFLLSLTLDLSAYYAEVRRTQELIDDAALYAYRFLPFQAQAERATQEYLGRFGVAAARVSPVADGIEIQVQRPFPLLFSRALGVGEAGLPVEVVTRVRGTPFDAFIAVDTSSHLSPNSEGGVTWGDDNSWPVAHYFEQPAFNPSTIKLHPRVLTQQCFNPAFSGLKLAAIRVLDYLSAFSLNSLGVGFFGGGELSGLEVARPVYGPATFPIASGTAPDAEFIVANKRWISGADCAAVASRDDSPAQYQFPLTPHALKPRGDLSGRPIALVNPGTREFNSEYAPFLQAREVIWSQITRGPALQSTSRLLLGLISELAAAKAVPARRGLVASSSHVAFVFAGELPSEEGVLFPDPGVVSLLRSTLEQSFVNFAQHAVPDSHTALFYILLQHPGIPDRGAAIAPLQALFTEVARMSGLSEQQLTLRVLYVRSPEELTEILLQSLSVMNKTAVLSL